MVRSAVQTLRWNAVPATRHFTRLRRSKSPLKYPVSAALISRGAGASCKTVAPYCSRNSCLRRSSKSSHSSAHNAPSASVTSKAMPIGVCSRSSPEVSGGFVFMWFPRCDWMLDAGGPQMQGRVSAPRPPSLGARQELCGRWTLAVSRSHRAHQADVGGGERVGFAQLAHRDVLRGPFTDARKRPQLHNRLFEAGAPAEDRRIGGNRLRQ